MKAKSRFNLLDAMILVGAIAVGLAWSRFQASIPSHLFSYFQMSQLEFPGGGLTPWDDWSRWVWAKYGLGAQPVAMVAVGLLAVQCRRSSADRRLILSQPGASCCVAVTIVLLLSAMRFLVDVTRFRLDVLYQWSFLSQGYTAWWESAYDALRPTEPGIAIIVCWSILALTGRMRFERSISDRLGCVVAAYWIVALVFYWIVGQV